MRPDEAPTGIVLSSTPLRRTNQRWQQRGLLVHVAGLEDSIKRVRTPERSTRAERVYRSFPDLVVQKLAIRSVNPSSSRTSPSVVTSELLRLPVKSYIMVGQLTGFDDIRPHHGGSVER